MLALHPTPVKGRFSPVLLHKLRLGFTVCSCPGPGSSWGNPAVPPASKEAESPSNLFYVDSICKGGGGEFKNTLLLPVCTSNCLYVALLFKYALEIQRQSSGTKRCIGVKGVTRG